ncbi:MAG: glycosyltransferase, partial [Actinomycetota bacterium]
MAGRTDGLRLVLVTGIYPPDIGGPATHAGDLVHEFRQRDHRVVVVSHCDGLRERREPGSIRFPRRWPWPRRHAAVVSWLFRNRNRYDVVYAIGLHPSAVAGALMARRPVVVKVAG